MRSPGRPLVRRRCPDRARPDEDDVGYRPEHAHDEAIRIEEPADLATAGAAIDIERNDTVEGRDEVGDDGRSIGTERDAQMAVVSIAEAWG
jgi:hypothetical protein